MDVNKLYVSECVVCPGPTLKRIMPRAKGSADRILKRTSHVTMVLKEKEA
jgi:large subunit ribosomal protein L22